MKKEKYYEKEALLRVLFMPIRDKLSVVAGPSMVEIREEEGFLFVVFLTPRGRIQLKCSPKRMVIIVWEVDLPKAEIQEILLRIAYFLRRNEMPVLTVVKSPETSILMEFLEKWWQDLLLFSYGKEICYELKVMDFISKAQQKL